MKKHLLSSIFAAGAIATASVLQAAPAEALSFDGQLAVFGRSDVGQNFTVDFVDNYLNGSSNASLKSTATVTITEFTNAGNPDNRTRVRFGINLTNNSTIDSFLTAFGFDVGAIVNGNINDGIGIRGNTQTDGNAPPNPPEFTQRIFNEDFGSPLGRREVAYAASSPEKGIPDGSSDSFNARLVLDLLGDNDQVTLYNFAVAYAVPFQVDNKTFYKDGAGRPIPTPALLPGLVGLAVGAMRKKQKAEVAQDA
jgi:hypothetical protein